MSDLFLTLVALKSPSVLNRGDPFIKSQARHAILTAWARRLALGLLLAFMACACSDARSVPLGECGNHVLEVGEDCDGRDGCTAACRFACDAKKHTCPIG